VPGDWARSRASALARLEAHAREGRVDEDIVEFLFQLNRKPCLFTTSSCSGRLALLEGEDFFDKAGARIVESWHDPGECRRRVREYCGVGAGRRVWASLQPPILHVVVEGEDVARRVAACGERAGFSRACYKPYRAGGYLVELAGSDKLHVVLPAPCEVLEGLCRVLERWKERLARLEECLLSLEC